MQLSKKTFVACMVLIAILSVSLTYAWTHQIFSIGHETKPNINVEYVFETWDGTFVFAKHNVITNIGENFTRDAFSQGNEENATKLAVGNVTGTLQTKTTLDAVYADPTDGSYVEGTIVEWLSSGDSAYNCTHKWTFEETVDLDGAALYIGNTTFCLAIANFPGGSQSFSSGENLTVRWTPVYDAND